MFTPRGYARKIDGDLAEQVDPNTSAKLTHEGGAA